MKLAWKERELRLEMKKLQVAFLGSFQIILDDENITDFLTQPSVEGALIGSASAKVEKLHAIIEKLEKTVCEE